MEASKHTPGPWIWSDHSLQPAHPDPFNYAVHTILNAEHTGWGFLASDNAKTTAESTANLVLIVAAPDLLDAALAAEAVLAKQKWLENSTDPESVALCKLRAAIARAGAA